MAFEELLDHRCAIYHMQKDKKHMGYGIETGGFCYPEKPDIAEVPCHFNMGDMGNAEQSEDVNAYMMSGKLQLPAGTDVRVNDKIVDLDSGLEYTAELPRNIRNHHMIVRVHRRGKVQGAL